MNEQLVSCSGAKLEVESPTVHGMENVTAIKNCMFGKPNQKAREMITEVFGTYKDFLKVALDNKNFCK